MFYCKDLWIPAQTGGADPARTWLSVSSGVVRRVWVRWRWGTGNLCGARILYQEFQQWPLAPGAWFPSTPDALEFAESLALDAEPYLLAIEGYNLDDTYPHTVWVAVEIDRPEPEPEMIWEFAL